MATKTKISRTEKINKNEIVKNEIKPGYSVPELFHESDIVKGELSTYTPSNNDVIDIDISVPSFAKEWNEVKPDFPPVFNFSKVGDYISGKLVEVQTDIGPNKSNLYILELIYQGKQKQVSIWEKRSLEIKMSKVPIGSMVFIQLVGLKPSKFGKDWYDFRVLSSAKIEE